MKLNIGVGRFPAPPPWLNVDVTRGEGIEPDLLVADTTIQTLSTALNGQRADRVYLGHVMEHIGWDEAVGYLTEMRSTILEPGGQIMVVGPDARKTVRMFRAGQVQFDLVLEVLEDDEHHQDRSDATGARHQWNCHEERLARLVEAAGYSSVTSRDLGSVERDGWPIVSQAGWQCAVSGVAS